jgi:5'-3' exonuclease, N-terminal resolvase-like domain
MFSDSAILRQSSWLLRGQAVFDNTALNARRCLLCAWPLSSGPHMNGSMASVPFRPQLTILRTEQMGDHPSRPLLVVDGDSFAHRAYHGLPKSIRRRGNRGAGAIVGFANFLLRLYETERPRAVLVAWDTLDVPTYRHRAFAGYQSGRQFDFELLDQLDVLPNFVAACGFVFAKSPGYEADDFLAAAVADEERHGGEAIVAPTALSRHRR